MNDHIEVLLFQFISAGSGRCKQLQPELFLCLFDLMSEIVQIIGNIEFDGRPRTRYQHSADLLTGLIQDHLVAPPGGAKSADNPRRSSADNRHFFGPPDLASPLGPLGLTDAPSLPGLANQPNQPSPFGPLGRCQFAAVVQIFETGPGVDRTLRMPPFHELVDAALLAADAGGDLSNSAGEGLVRPLGVG